MRALKLLALLPFAALLGGCDFVVLAPAGDVAVQQRDLVVISTVLMLIIVLPVMALTLFFAWRYRQSNTAAPYEPEWDHSTQLELVIWSAPLLIIICLGALTWMGTHLLDPYRSLGRIAADKPIESKDAPLNVEVVALDWKWLFIYPEQGIATVNELAFPKDVPVEFKITSNSVMNSFFIPQLGGQIYAMAGMQTKLHLIGNEAGAYKGISSSYSGAGFSGMKFTAIVTPTEGDFDQWVAKVKASPKNLNTTDDFNKLAEPSENNPVEYFAAVKPNLFKETIAKFMGDMDMHKGAGAHEGMDMSQGMDMGEHAAHAGAEE